MLAKIVAHGPTRDIAFHRLAAALEATEVAGTVTNLDFLTALLRHPGVRVGRVDTGLIARDLAALLPARGEDPRLVARAALALAGLDEPSPLQGFALWRPQERRLDLEAPVTIAVEGPGRALVRIGDAALECRRGDGFWWIGGAKVTATVVVEMAWVSVLAGGRGALRLRRIDALAREAAGRTENLTVAPMPGMVKAVLVAAGDSLQRGVPVAVLEAMKMEHVLLASGDGIVAEVLVTPGAQVGAGAALIRLEDPLTGAGG